MFQRMYVDEPDNWTEVDEETARDKLSAYFQNIDEVIQDMKTGVTYRTPWAFYRWITVE